MIFSDNFQLVSLGKVYLIYKGFYFWKKIADLSDRNPETPLRSQAKRQRFTKWATVARRWFISLDTWRFWGSFGFETTPCVDILV